MIKIAISSGKGGTDITFIATNIFYTLLKNNYRAMLVDCAMLRRQKDIVVHSLKQNW
jgi:MinD superfamily P-loop ATPase